MAWRLVFLIFGMMGFIWTFVWIITYRDVNPSVANGNDETFFPSMPKVLFSLL